MSDEIDVIILDDDSQMCSLVTDILRDFYVWGNIHAFTKYDDALAFCKKKKIGVAVFILDIYLDQKTAFDFLEQISDQCAWASEDTVIITGKASEDIVNRCIESNIHYLLEKPMKTYTLQLAVRAIVGKYLCFAKRLLGDVAYADRVAKI